MRFRVTAALAVLTLTLSACTSRAPTATPATTSPPATPTAPAQAVVPAPAHTVVVVMENHPYADVIGNPQAPYINQLARTGALFTDSRAITHPSEPNYLALFSGSTQGITDDSCPHQFTAANLGSELVAADHSFAGYAEGLPTAEPAVCKAGAYARKHAPWIDFRNVPAADSKPFSSFPAGNYTQLPTVSFVIPDLCHDMHDCPVAIGDDWLRAHLAGYAQWVMTHHSLLIVTWDENNGSPGNQIATIFTGQQVRTGRYAQPITHYSVLRTLESLYRLPVLGHTAAATVITAIWK
jgi:phosphatidylinositol-3-phosphatase